MDTLVFIRQSAVLEQPVRFRAFTAMNRAF